MNALTILAAAGMTNIIVDSDMPIVKGFREMLSLTPLKKLVTCYPCAGFWCGIVCAHLQSPWASSSHLFLSGCVASLCAAFVACLFDMVDVLIPPEDSNE